MSGRWISLKECPICKKPRCRLLAEKGIIKCWRTGYTGRATGAMLLSADRSLKSTGAPVSSGATLTSFEAAEIHRQCVREAAERPDQVARLAEQLGLTTEALSAFQIGRHGSAWTFPMFDGERRIIGLRTRLPDGSKRSIKGSRNGLFVASDFAPGPTLFVTEGATDAMAAWDVGLRYAIGRPSSSSGAPMVATFAKRTGARRVIVIPDADAAGEAGLSRLIEECAIVGVAVAVSRLRQYKDLRQAVVAVGRERARAAIPEWLAKLGVEPSTRLPVPVTRDA